MYGGRFALLGAGIAGSGGLFCARLGMVGGYRAENRGRKGRRVIVESGGMSSQPPHSGSDAEPLWSWAKAEDPDAITSSDTLSDGIRPARWDDFLSRVERVCRLHEGAGARIECVAVGGSGSSRSPSRGPFRAFLLVTKLNRGIAEEHPVAALDQPVTEEILEAFLRDIDARFRDADPAVRSELVYRGELASEALCQRARRRALPRSLPRFPSDAGALALLRSRS